MAKYYERSELESLTVYKLNEICGEEVLVKSALFDLDREDLIELILRYRGAGEPALIDEMSEEGMARLSDALKSSVRLSERRGIEAPSKIVAHKGMDLTATDGLVIRGRPLPEPGIAFLMSGGTELCAILGLKRSGDNELFIIRNGGLPAKESDHRNYSLWCMDGESSERIRALCEGKSSGPGEYRAVSVPVLDFFVREPISAETPLAIDFGTTNTTAGIYLDDTLADEMEARGGLRADMRRDAVNPVYVMRKNGAQSPLIPTAVAAFDVSGETKYVFGEDAVFLATSAYAQEGISVFLDIKRWISAPDEKEEVIDRNGRRAQIPRKEIIRAYLLHVVGSAEQYFKCRFSALHISAPVKQRHSFRDFFGTLLPEYTLIEALDEGAAVLYNTVAARIKSGNFENGRDYRALIADSGGGTTDLTSCRYRIENRKIGYHVTMETVYENGDVNFGGNSLTYRLLQMLKIMVAARADKSIVNENAVWASFERDAYRFADEHGTEAYYAELERQYGIAENLIPTKYKEWEKRAGNDYIQVKSNFYELFRLAERIKEEFFGTRDVLALRILSKDDFEKAKRFPAAAWDASEFFPVPNRTLSFVENGALRKKKGWPAFTISIRQIERIFAADIYGVMKKFLGEPFRNGELQMLDGIKLTGQSCKIGLFKDVLKEFVPGMLLSFGRVDSERDDPYSLKLTCLYGALHYLHASRAGFVKADMPRRQPFLPYLLVADTHEGREEILINSLDRQKLSGFVSRHLSELSLRLMLRDSDGTPKHDFVYRNDPRDFVPVLYEELEKRYDHIPQSETDVIVESEVKFFVAAKPNEWGFVVVPVAREKEGLSLGKERFFTLEDSAWETDCFDGLK
jgi:hypothetical protein